MSEQTLCETCGEETSGGELCWDCYEIEMNEGPFEWDTEE